MPTVPTEGHKPPARLAQAVVRLTVQGNRMQVPLKPLKQGSYRVTWHALSVDAHRTNGTYTFRVAP